MRSKLKRAVMKRFLDHIPAICPEFELFQKEHDMLRWKRKIAENLIYIISVWTHDQGDIFNVDLRWTNDEDNWFYGKAHLYPENESGNGSLTWLTMTGPGFIPCFELDPERESSFGTGDISNIIPQIALEIALNRADPLVDDALNQIRQYAMPFFHKVAETHNIPWPDDLAALYPQSYTPPKLL
jgi:hypothetical protein